MLITLVLIALAEDASSAELETLFDQMDGVYLALLGGPYAAFLLARVAVQQKTTGTGEDKPTLQIATTEQPGPSDLIQYPSGNTDIVNLQYILFNVVAAVYALSQFLPHPGGGIPILPASLAVLTGGSAATYVGNRALASNAPKVTAIVPTSISSTSTEWIDLFGSNLQTPGTTTKSFVLVGGVKAEVNESASTMDRIPFKPPSNLAQIKHSVEVITAAGLKAPAADQVTILP